MPENYFGEEVAAEYDDTGEHDPMFAPEAINPVVDFLVELAGDGQALELGIGTGRIALPLAERGVPVHGIDLSEAMVARLRAKPGGDRMGVTIGDFATTKVDGRVNDLGVEHLRRGLVVSIGDALVEVAVVRHGRAPG